MPDVQGPDDTILHQDAVEDVVDARVGERIDGVDDENTAIADLVDITGGQAPTEAEYNLVVAAVNDILAALRSSGVIPDE